MSSKGETNMSRILAGVLALLAVGLLATTASATTVTFWYSTSNTIADQAITNPVLNISGGGTVTLYIWALPTAFDENSQPLNTLAIGGWSSNPGVSFSAPTLTNAAARWSGGSAGALYDAGAEYVMTGANNFTGGAGLQAGDAFSANGKYLIGSVVVTAAPSVTSAQLYLAESASPECAYFGPSSLTFPNVYLGSDGNGGVDPAVVLADPSTYDPNYDLLPNGEADIFWSGGASKLPDATIGVPEPATMALLAFGGIGMLLRRRSRN